MTKIWKTSSAEETIAAGRTIAALLAPPKLLILRGDLGAGKTTLVKGIAAGLVAVEVDEVTSPTFTLVHEYSGRDDGSGIMAGGSGVIANGAYTSGDRISPGQTGEPVKLFHLDLYRLEQERELLTLGLEEIEAPGNIVLVEWGEKFASIASRADGEIAIRITGDDAREITLQLG